MVNILTFQTLQATYHVPPDGAVCLKWRWIRIQQGSAAPAAFTLVTGPPAPKTLDDDAATLKDAGLLGAVILQK